MVESVKSQLDRLSPEIRDWMVVLLGLRDVSWESVPTKQSEQLRIEAARIIPLLPETYLIRNRDKFMELLSFFEEASSILARGGNYAGVFHMIEWMNTASMGLFLINNVQYLEYTRSHIRIRNHRPDAPRNDGSHMTI